MFPTYGRAIPLLWFSWLALWGAWSRDTKAAARRESRRSWLSHNVPLLTGAALLATARPRRSARTRVLIGTLGVAAGLGVTVSARREIGRDWSAAVTVKRGHELVRTGPYALVRHPIYAGMLLALAATAWTRGDGRGLLALTAFAGALVRKMRIEERFMAERFREEYGSYRRGTPALIPSFGRRSAP